jgi:hypothetical protein
MKTMAQEIKEIHEKRLKQLVELGFYKNMRQARRHWHNAKHT